MWTLATNDLDRSLTGPSRVDLDLQNLENNQQLQISSQVSLFPIFGTDNEPQNAISPRKVPTTEYIKVALSQRGSFSVFSTSMTF